jgi:general secretion pathway protein D
MRMPPMVGRPLPSAQFALFDLLKVDIMTKLTLITSTALISLSPALLTGCTMLENQLKLDRETNQEFQDIRDAFSAREVPASEAASANGIPEFTDYTNTQAANLKPMPLVTVSVNETIPLKDVLYELAQQANYDLEIDPRIDGAIIFSAKNRPFDEVMSRIAELAGLRFKFDNEVVRVEIDTPYSSTYKIDYLPMARTVTSSIQNNASFAGSGGEGGSATSASGSTFSLQGTTEVDFWKELDTNIAQILQSNSVKNVLRSDNTPVVTNAPPATPPATPTPEDDQAAGGDNNAEGDDDVVTTAEAPPAAAPTINVAASTAGSADINITPTYSVNKQAGLVSVFANEKVHKKIQAYLDDLKRSVSSQVLIEARILEVSLEDRYATGINWSGFNQALGDITFTSSNPIQSLSSAAASSFSVGVAGNISGNDVDALIRAISKYGSVRALSSPRMTVLNKQSAVLNVATNRVYFKISQEESTIDQAGNAISGGVTVETKSVPEGVLVNVTPSIDPSRGEVVLNLRPTITRIESRVKDPSIGLINAVNQGVTLPADLSNEIPELGVQEFDSVLKVRSGETVIMGGLMRDRSLSNAEGVPAISELPLFGNLFKSTRNEITKSEIVVLLRATIMNNPSDGIHQTDRDLYKTFSRDRRPLPL